MREQSVCWAESLGDCEGPITREHLVTEGLFGGRVQVRGDRAMPNGTRSDLLIRQGVDIGIGRLTANILCDRHNRMLGRTADRAAIDLQRVLLRTRGPTRLRGSRIHRPPASVHVSGVNFARWLCKTHCNLMVANGYTPDISFIKYPFGQMTDKRIFFYFAGRVGDTLPVGRGHITYQNYVDDRDQSVPIFQIRLAGLTTVVSTFSINTMIAMGIVESASPFLDRLRCIQQPTPLGYYRIEIDWGGEPGVLGQI